MMNIFEQQAKKIQEVKKEITNVIPFPTQELAEELRKQGKVIVHKPNSIKSFNNDDDLPPEAA